MNTVDAGTAFGTWPDRTSRLIYGDAMPALLTGVERHGRTLDLGGGNGLLRRWFDNLTTVDSDPNKYPDVVDDVLTWEPEEPYDRVVLRYVLHYLNDTQVRELLAHIASYHTGELVVIQFVNQDLEAKYRNSVNELKWFRTEHHLSSLLTERWQVTQRIALSYDVDPEFYRNRLGSTRATGHPETVVAYRMEQRP